MTPNPEDGQECPAGIKFKTDGPEVPMPEPVDPKRTVLLTVWDKLSDRCREDLRQCRPGAIIRCTLKDFEYLRSVEVLPDTKLERQVLDLEQRLNSLDVYTGHGDFQA